MKQLLLLLLMTVFCLSTSTTAFAAASSTPAPTSTAKKGIVEKLKAKVASIALNEMSKKDAGDVNIPGSKKTWLLYWILGVVATIVLAFTIGGILTRLVSAATSIAFIIWILKLLDVV